MNVKRPPLFCRDLGVGFRTSKGLSIILTVLVILLVSALVILFCYRRLSKEDLGKELSTEASNMVSRYMAMKDHVSMIEDDEKKENGVEK